MTLTVLIADDHPVWRDALVQDLQEAGFAVVGTAADGPSAVNRTKAARPDVLVLDLNLPGLHGADVCAEVSGLATKVLILSASGEEADVLAAMKAGASGYLVKSATRAEITAAVEATGRGEAIFTPGLAGMVLGEFRKLAAEPGGAGSDRPVPELTDREVEILRLVAMGLSSKEIAEQLLISYRTVQNHIQNTLGKLHLHNRVELTRFAIDRGITSKSALPT